jgi:hypothetical protein
LFALAPVRRGEGRGEGCRLLQGAWFASDDHLGMRLRVLGSSLLVLCLFTACASDDDPIVPTDVRVDTTPPADAGPKDTATPLLDGAAVADTSVPDAATDAPPPADAPAPDAPPADASPPDAPAPDAPAVDAAPPADARVVDTPPAMCGRIFCDCTFNGVKLWGKVQYVTLTADPDVIKVRETSFPDLRVKETAFPDSCGEWEVVTAFPDFKVQKVTAFEDFQIQYSAFPGLPP